MIKYELAEKLKEAGFPQTTNESYYLNAGVNTGAIVTTAYYEDADEEFRKHKLVACPTHSEILSLLEGEITLNMVSEKQFVIKDETGREGHGETDVEAAAYLWLAQKQFK